MHKGQKSLIKQSVRQSIALLLKEAERAHNKAGIQQPASGIRHPAPGNTKLRTQDSRHETRYLQMVMDLVRKHKVRLTKEQKNLFCRKCLVWWVPGETVTLVYDQQHHLIRVKCKCGYTRVLSK